MLLVVGRRAYRATGDARTPAWFRFWRTYRLCVEGGWVVWLAVAFGLSTGEQLARVLPGWPAGLLWLLAMNLPPTVVGFAGHVTARLVLSRLHDVQGSAGDAAAEAAGALLSKMVPVLCLLAAAWSLVDDESAGPPSLWILVAFASVIAGGALLRRATGLAPHALAQGELRDRAFALAGQAGIPLRALFLLPARKTRMANAFAHFQGVVMLTDYLVERMPRRELDAVVAHELGHLRHRHVRVRLQLVVLSIIAIAVVAGTLEVGLQLASSWLEAEWIAAWGHGLMMAIGISGLLAAFYLTSRRQERAADATSAEITQDPEAMIAALGRLSRLGLMPAAWGAITETFTTHPATLRRAQALAMRFAVPFERMRELLERGTEEDGGYPIPPATLVETRCYTTPWKQAAGLRLGLSLVVAGTGVVVAVGVAVDRAGLHGWAAVVAYAIALAISALLTVELSNLLAARGYGGLRKRLAAQLPAADAAAAARGESWFVGLGPADRPRIYDGHTVWDLGHLRLGDDALVFRGDGESFALPREAIAAVRLGPGAPGWISTRYVYVDWNAGDGTRRTFYLNPFTRTLRGSRPLAESILAAIVQWRERRDAAAGGAELPLPAWGEVTGVSPRQALNNVGMFISLAFIAVLAWAALDLLAATSQLLPVLLVAAARFFFSVLPYLRYREAGTANPAGAPA